MTGAPRDERPPAAVRAVEPDEAEVRAVLRARAEALARRDDDEAPVAIVEALAFRLADETYAIETSLIREVYPLNDLTPVPCTPPHIVGLISVRGAIITVVDLRRLLGLPHEGITNLNRVIVVERDDVDLGILADEIAGITEIPESALDGSLPAASGTHADHIRGVVAGGPILLDTAAVLDDPRLVVHEEVGP